MAEPPQRRLQALLQAAVQTVQWTYSIYWQFCPQQGIIAWSDGYYNGAIKTRKTVQATEESAEEATLQRSQQLRDLYETLAAGETSHQQERRPSASLSPEDLTESEWFYLMCVSFSFPPGIGLPGKAYVDRQHIWLTRANKADNKLFSRAILAESAKIQTVVCIPILDGIVELGTTERVEEDMEMMERVKSIFIEYQNPRPAPALSSHSTCNPATSSSGGPPGFYSPLLLPPFEPEPPPPQLPEEEEDEVGSDPDPVPHPDQTLAEAMQLDLSSDDQDIRVGSPDDSSNNLGSNSHRHAATDMLRRPCNQTHLQPSHSVDVIAEEDTHYSQTVSSILENQSNRWSKLSSSAATSSAFSKWLAAPPSRNLLLDGASQWVLKYVLFTLPLLHTKPRGEELNGNHVLAERRRREKLNERFVTLRSMVPFVTKMDKASILADTIEYLKQLKKRIQELESRARKMDKDKEIREKRKTRVHVVEPKVGGQLLQEAVEVSIIESEGLVEFSCLHRGGLLLDVMQALGALGLQVTTVQSSIDNAATFNAELRAKVKENVSGRKPSIMEVKRTIKQIIRPH